MWTAAERASAAVLTVGARAAPKQLRSAARSLRRPGVSRIVARTAVFNVSATIAAGLAGLLIARTLGPTGRGEYAAITVWFGVMVLVGGLGQPAAICYYVASDRRRARDYVTTSRSLMLVTGTVTVIGGLLLAPVLSHNRSTLEQGYRIAFIASVVALVGATYTFSLQATAIHRWNRIWLTQPVVYLIGIVTLRAFGILTLEAAIVAVAVSVAIQLLFAWWECRRVGLTGGRTSRDLVQPLTRYGVSQLFAAAPTTVNLRLDQLVLSQTVASADLGRYAVAVTLTTLALPVVSAVGNVAFPRLAEMGANPSANRLQERALIVSAVVATGILGVIALTAYWLVPLLVGGGFRGAVPLIWILAPGGIFLACGQVAGDLLRGRGRPIIVAYAQGAAAVFTVALLIGLLPLIGVAAAAIASTVAYGVALAVMVQALRQLAARTATSSEPERLPGQEPRS